MCLQIAAQLAIEQTHDGAVPIWELEPSWIPDMCAHALTTSQIQLQIEADQADGNEVAGKRPHHLPCCSLLLASLHILCCSTQYRSMSITASLQH